MVADDYRSKTSLVAWHCVPLIFFYFPISLLQGICSLQYITEMHDVPCRIQRGTNAGKIALFPFTHTKGSQFPSTPEKIKQFLKNCVAAGVLKGKHCEGKVSFQALRGERVKNGCSVQWRFAFSSIQMPVFHQKCKPLLHLESSPSLIIKVDISMRTRDSMPCKSKEAAQPPPCSESSTSCTLPSCMQNDVLYPLSRRVFTGFPPLVSFNSVTWIRSKAEALQSL